MQKYIVLFIAVIFLIACNSNQGNEEQAANKAEALLDSVVAGHDVAMPQMKKLERLQKEVQAAIDSLSKIPAAAASPHKAALDSSLKDLNYASFAMEKWMQEFGYDSLKDNEAERVKYLESELVKVNNMKDAVLNSISKADSLLKK